MAWKYLCIPATSVPEQFSTAGNIVNAKNSCLSPENTNMLTFLAQNLQSLSGQSVKKCIPSLLLHCNCTTVTVCCTCLLLYMSYCQAEVLCCIHVCIVWYHCDYPDKCSKYHDITLFIIAQHYLRLKAYEHNAIIKPSCKWSTHKSHVSYTMGIIAWYACTHHLSPWNNY